MEVESLVGADAVVDVAEGLDVLDEGLADLFAGALNNIEHARGQPGVEGDLCHQHCRQGLLQKRPWCA